MTKHYYLLLNNQKGEDRNFDHSRGIDDTKKEDSEKHYNNQKEKLGSCLRSFSRKIEERHNRRDKINVGHIDYITINFLKPFDSNFEKKFIHQYGLSLICYSNMNNTVTFAVSNEEKFNQSFLNGIESYSRDLNNDNVLNFKDFTTIQDFLYIDNKDICKESSNNIDGYPATLRLAEPLVELREKMVSIKSELFTYLKNQNVRIDDLTDNLVQVTGLTSEGADYILSNYDIIISLKTQSCRKPKISPSEFGTIGYSTGLNIHIPDNLPTIGVIDSGAYKESPCKEILNGEGVDLSDAPHKDPFHTQSDHGTTVSCLASYGLNMFKDPANYDIEADALVYTIKILNDEEGKIAGLAQIKKAIIDAVGKGIRIFNLSITTNKQKGYNEGESEFGYLLDQLAYDYDILIFISTGNLDIDLIKELQNNYVNAPQERHHYYGNPFHFFYPDDDDNFLSEMTNLYAPADSMNNITVGAVADNFNVDETCDLSQNKSYPAIYTLKSSTDYNKEVNGVSLNKNQKNKYLFKPDIVMPGGDLLKEGSKMQVIGKREGVLDYVRNSGTSYAAPLAANLAAKILRIYPKLKMQTVKAIIINSCHEIDSHYLDSIVEDKKRRYCKENSIDFDNLKKNEKRELSVMFNSRQMNHYLTGYGLPDVEEAIMSSDNNTVNFVIEDRIENDSYRVMSINLPAYLYQTDQKTKIHIKATLCYNFNPVFDEIIGYNPVHISFNICNSIVKDDPNANAQKYSTLHVNKDDDVMRIKAHTHPWSDDFYPVNNKIFSNVQTLDINITSEELKRIQGQISLIVRCACKQKYEGKTRGPHLFSLALNISEHRPKKSKIQENLYNEIININRVENIVSANLEANLEA